MALISIENIPPAKFKQGLLLSSTIFSIIFILNKLHVVSLGAASLSDNFIKQVFGHSYLADLLVITFPFTISSFSQKSIKTKNFFNFFLFLFFLTTLFLTNSRSGIIALAAGILFLTPKNIPQKIVKWFLVILPILFIFLSFSSNYQNKFEKTLSGEREKYWAIAFNGFLRSPIFGNGPNSFPIIRKGSKNLNITTNLTHNSILNFLCENGVIFTLIICIGIFCGLKKTRKKNNIFFVASIITITHSLLDPTWNSPGIFIISLYLIFYNYPIFSENQSSNNKQTYFFIILAIFCFIFSISDSISNNLLIDKKLNLSLIFNPFNLDSRLEIISTIDPNSAVWKNNLDFTLKYFGDNTIVYQRLIKSLPFPDNEKYYYKFFTLSPEESYPYYQLIIEQINNDPIKLEKFLNYINQNFQENEIPSKYAIPLSKISYNYAIKLYSTNRNKALNFFRLTTKLLPISGYYQVELANALWHENKTDEAINQLSINCQQYIHAKEQCQAYLNGHQYTNFNQPGNEEFTKYVNQEL